MHLFEPSTNIKKLAISKIFTDNDRNLSTHTPVVMELFENGGSGGYGWKVVVHSGWVSGAYCIFWQ